MRRLIAAVILIAFNCIVVLAQHTVKQSPTPRTSALPVVPASDSPREGSSFRLLASHLTFGHSHPNELIVPLSGESTKQESPFVVLNGAVYTRALGARLLIPMPGGGASGCFSLNLPQRITNLENFVPKLEQVKPQREQY